LLARPDAGASGALVVAAPDVVAGVLRVAQHGPKLRAVPGLPGHHLVCGVGGRRWIAGEIAVELVNDLSEPQSTHAVVIKDHQHDRGAHGIENETVLSLALPVPGRVGMPMLLQQVTIWCSAAGVPALADALLHPAAAALDQVAHVPLRDALLDPPGEDRGCVGGHRLISSEQPNISSFEITLDSCRICRHPR
jgi:hypothetical protein